MCIFFNYTHTLPLFLIPFLLIVAHEFIYFVLEIVPLNRFKELVRRLNVSEQDIDRAERDNRAFADAQYQMLMVWIDSSSKGGKSVLPHPLLQECVDRLNDMNLTACVESIEDKYTWALPCGTCTKPHPDLVMKSSVETQ